MTTIARVQEDRARGEQAVLDVELRECSRRSCRCGGTAAVLPISAYLPSPVVALFALFGGLLFCFCYLAGAYKHMHAAVIVGMIGGVSLALIIVGLLALIWRPPATFIRYLQQRYPEILWEKSNVQGQVIALTIDDGPSSYTQEILDILKANEATATFFAIGSHMAGNEEVLRQLLTNGNELGNHAVYDEPSWRLSDRELSSQIRMVDEQITAHYHAAGLPRPPRYFRPGSGFFTRRMRAVGKDLGYSLVLGSIYPHDPQIQSARLNAWHIMSLLRPGAIIICHDGRKWTAPMLRNILPRIKKRGYRVVCLSQLLQDG